MIVIRNGTHRSYLHLTLKLGVEFNFSILYYLHDYRICTPIGGIYLTIMLNRLPDLGTGAARLG